MQEENEELKEIIESLNSEIADYKQTILSIQEIK
jgi:peptidoglycan hydrolase CwlO-like protein